MIVQIKAKESICTSLSVLITAWFLLLGSYDPMAQSTSKEDVYDIVSYLYDLKVKPLPPAPPPQGTAYFDKYSRKWVFYHARDSIKYWKAVERNLVKDDGMVVAIAPEFIDPGLEDFSYQGTEKRFKVLVDSLKAQAGGEAFSIDSLKAKSGRKDSIVFFSDEYLIKGRATYKIVNRVVSFSRPVLNNDRTHAVVTMSLYLSKLAGGYVIYFLRKEGDQWIIADSRLIHIS